MPFAKGMAVRCCNVVSVPVRPFCLQLLGFVCPPVLKEFSMRSAMLLCADLDGSWVHVLCASLFPETSIVRVFALGPEGTVGQQ